MLDALARSIAQTAADVLGGRSDAQGGVSISDEAIGAHLWFERGFRDHGTLVSLINHTRHLLDERTPSRPSSRIPVQLVFDLGAT